MPQGAVRTSWHRLVPAAASILCLVLAARAGGPNVTIVAAVALASAVSSVAGFAFSAICGAILFHLDRDAVEVVEIMMLCSVANQLAMVWSLRRTIDWTETSIYLAGGLLGLPLGLMLLLHAPHDLYRHAIGSLLVLYGAAMLAKRPVVLRTRHRAVDGLIGALGGITGGAMAFPGAPVTVWCSLKGWDKDRQRAVFQPFILVMQVVAIVALAFVGGGGAPVSIRPVDLLCVPVSVFGTSLGLSFYRRLSDSQFATVVNLLVVVSGVGFLI